MKRIVALLFVVALVFTAVCGCATDPNTGKKSVDWPAVSQYYTDYVMGFAVPVGSTAAAIMVPEAAPLALVAAKEAGMLDGLLKSKAGNEAITAQAAIVQQAIQTVNQAVK